MKKEKKQEKNSMKICTTEDTEYITTEEEESHSLMVRIPQLRTTILFANCLHFMTP